MGKLPEGNKIKDSGVSRVRAVRRRERGVRFPVTVRVRNSYEKITCRVNK